MSRTCPDCGASVAAPGHTWALSAGRVLALVGGLALVAAFFMPWFGTQGIILTGQFLDQFLGNTNDLRRFLPGSSGNPAETQALRALVFLFPVGGVLIALLALLGALPARLRTPTGIGLLLAGVITLAALIGGATRLPPGASIEIGLWTIAAGSIAAILGASVDLWLSHSPRPADGTD